MKYSTFAYSTLTTALVILSVSCAPPPGSEPALDNSNAATEAVGETLPSRLEGEPQPLGDGIVRSYVQLNDQNQPQEVGVILTENALNNLPGETAEVVLALPDQASGTVINHIGLNWLPQGHAPAPIYGAPHFDVHFYTITPEQRAAITEADLEKSYKTPDATLIPSGYVTGPDSAEPYMGAHWVNAAAEELQGHPHGFSHTLIYGFHDGETAFIEPMVALDYLRSQEDFESPISLPERFSQPGSFPTGYRITYEEATGEYTVALTDFVRITSPTIDPSQKELIHGPNYDASSDEFVR